MLNQTKASAVISLLLVAAILATTIPYIAGVKAQGQATVVVAESFGGSTDPLPGTYSYATGATVTFTATPDEANSFVFSEWVISTDASNSTETSNPFTLTVAADVTYTVSAIFFIPDIGPIPPITTIPPSVSARFVILQAAGGHATPSAGTYFLNNQSQLVITAVPDDGWKFDHWIISGRDLTGHGGSPAAIISTDNPLILNHGFGYSYDFQPVFTPTSDGGNGGNGGNGGTGGFSTETIVIIGLVIVIAVILVAFGAYAYSKRAGK